MTPASSPWPSRAPMAPSAPSSVCGADELASAPRRPPLTRLAHPPALTRVAYPSAPMEVTMLSEGRARPRRVAVGEFDGVHLGHREVIRGNDTVLTFEPHPLQVVRPEAAPKLLTSLEAKAELIAGLGVDELVVIPFDEGFAHQTPEEFIDHILIERLCATRG